MTPQGDAQELPRKRLYGTGAPRTGTHTIAATFDRSVRAAHEPGLRAAMQAVLAFHRGGLSFDDLRRFVRRRDARWRLEVDASHVNVFLAAAIAAEFPDARFVLTVRDCYSWTDAVVNHTLNARRWWRPEGAYVGFYLGPDPIGSQHDAPLRRHGLRSIDGYFAAWDRHNRRALDSIPAERLLVVRTCDLDTSPATIAAFAGIPAERLGRTLPARSAAKVRHALLAAMDPGHLAERAEVHCGELMRRFFPSIRSPHDAGIVPAPSP